MKVRENLAQVFLHCVEKIFQKLIFHEFKTFCGSEKKNLWAIFYSYGNTTFDTFSDVKIAFLISEIVCDIIMFFT